MRKYKYTVESYIEECLGKTKIINMPNIINHNSFTKDYIISITGINSITMNDTLQIFMNFIDIYNIGNKNILINDDNIKEIITNIINNPYKYSKIYKLKQKIEKLDDIYKIFHEKIDYNNIDRIDFILKKEFKNEYLSKSFISNILCNKYQISSDISDKLIIHPEKKYVILKEYYMKEEFIVDFINKLINSKTIIPKIQKTEKLDDNQIDILNKCIQNNISIITGLPGTGKSEIVGNLLNNITNCLVLAPTGCAVENIQNRFPDYAFKCSTLHSFYHNKNDTLLISDKLNIIIIDEFSMVDIFIFYKVLTLLTKYLDSLKLILVGDPNQLPSIKLGKLLEDFINSNKINYFKLTKSYRSNNEIPKILNHLLNKRELRVCKDVEYIKYEKPEDLKIDNIYQYFYDINNIILCPTNESVNELNQYIQSKNPNNILYINGNCSIKFKLEDKIIFLKNTSEYKLYNGTILYIKNININGNLISFKFDKNREFECKLNEISTYIKLGYAKTIHKAQGSGYNIVYLLLNKYPKIMWDIKLLYTAISRAKIKCYFSGIATDIQKSCSISKKKISSISHLLN